MTVNERIKYLRKDVLHLNQKQFALDIGMAQTGVSTMEQDGATITDRVIKAISLAYGINETWLRTGEGDIRTQEPTFSLDQFVKERGASELEIEILKAYFEMDPQIRRTVFEHFKSRFASASRDAPAAGLPAATPDAPGSVEDAEAAYIKALHSASATGSSALNITEGTEENGGSIKKASGK